LTPRPLALAVVLRVAEGQLHRNRLLGSMIDCGRSGRIVQSFPNNPNDASTQLPQGGSINLPQIPEITGDSLLESLYKMSPLSAISQLEQAISNSINNCDDDDRCEREWREARRVCRQLIFEQLQQAAGRRKKRSVTGVTGGFTDIEQCARGLVSQQCGGNKVQR
ncbi:MULTISPECIES: hypothetical protein, partial [Xanthomonas]